MTTRNGDMEELIDEPIDEAEARWINITLIDAFGMIAGNYFFPGYGGYIGVGASAIAEEIDRLPPVGPVPPGPPIDYEPWTCNPKFI